MRPLHPSVIFLLLLIGVVTFGVVLIVIFDQPGFIKTTVIGEDFAVDDIEGGECALPVGEGFELDDEGTILGLSSPQRSAQPRPTTPANPPYCECLCGIFTDPQDRERLTGLLCSYGYTRQNPPTHSIAPRYYYCENNWFHRMPSTITEERCYDLEQERYLCSGNYLYGRVINNVYHQCKVALRNARVISCIWVSANTPAPQQEE